MLKVPCKKLLIHLLLAKVVLCATEQSSNHQSGDKSDRVSKFMTNANYSQCVCLPAWGLALQQHHAGVSLLVRASFIF